MTVAELIEELKKFPPDLNVRVAIGKTIKEIFVVFSALRAVESDNEVFILTRC